MAIRHFKPLAFPLLSRIHSSGRFGRCFRRDSMISIFTNSGSNIFNAFKVGSRTNTQATTASASDTKEQKQMLQQKGIKVSKEAVDHEFNSLFAPNSFTNLNILSSLTNDEGKEPNSSIFKDFVRCYTEGEEGDKSLGEYDIEGIIHTVGARYAALRYEIYNGDFKDQDALVANIRSQFHEGVNFLSEKFAAGASQLFTKLGATEELENVAKSVQDIANFQKTQYVIFTNSHVGEAYLDKLTRSEGFNFLTSDMDLTTAILRHEATLRAMANESADANAASSGHTSFVTTASGDSLSFIKAISNLSKEQGASGSFVNTQAQNKLHANDNVYIHELHLNDVKVRTPKDPSELANEAATAFKRNIQGEDVGVEVVEDHNNENEVETAQASSTFFKTLQENFQEKVTNYDIADLKNLSKLQSSFATFLNEDSNKSEAEIGFQLGLTLVKGLEGLKHGNAQEGRLGEVFITNFTNVIDGTIEAVNSKLSTEQESSYTNIISDDNELLDPYAFLSKDEVYNVFEKTADAYLATGSANDAVVNGFDAAKESFINYSSAHENLARNVSGRKFFVSFYQNNKGSANMYGIGQSVYHKYTFAINRI